MNEPKCIILQLIEGLIHYIFVIVEFLRSRVLFNGFGLKIVRLFIVVSSANTLYV